MKRCVCVCVVGGVSLNNVLNSRIARDFNSYAHVTSFNGSVLLLFDDDCFAVDIEMPKTEIWYDAYFVVTAGTAHDSLLCHQWRQSKFHDNSWFFRRGAGTVFLLLHLFVFAGKHFN